MLNYLKKDYLLKTLVVFDFDFTIARTVEKIWVWSPRGDNTYGNKNYFAVPRDITSTALDETIDEESFKEFYDIDISRTTLIEPIVQHLLFYTNICNTEITILTARPQKCEQKIRTILESFNANNAFVDVVGLQNSRSEAKVAHIQDKITLCNYTSLIIYEDNLDVINKIKQHFTNINIVTNLVKNFSQQKTQIEYNH